MGLPSMRIDPLSAFSRWMRQRRRVLFPDPEADDGDYLALADGKVYAFEYLELSEGLM